MSGGEISPVRSPSRRSQVPSHWFLRSYFGTTFVEGHFAALRYMPPDAFVAFLPAYLAALVEGGTENELPALVFSQLTRRAGWEEKFDSRASLLDKSQRQAIVRMLEELERGERFSHYRSGISDALSSWKSVLSRWS